MRVGPIVVMCVLGCSSSSERSTPTDAGIDSSSDTSGPDAPGLPSCLGEPRPMVLGANLPFVSVGVGATKSQGSFLIDFATTSSTIDLAAFSPAPATTGCDPTRLGQRCTFDEFDFFGSWGSVRLSTADHSGLIGGVREAGIVGTDFLSVHTFTLDYAGRRILRAKKGEFCSDAELTAAGFATLTSAGFYASDTSKLAPLTDVTKDASAGVTVPNVPTVPISIAGVEGIAQLDTGFADSIVPFSVNVNTAYYDKLAALLVRAATKDLVLTTCVPGVSESVEAHTLASGAALRLGARSFQGAVIFVKRTPDAARSCGGIGTWSVPAAQVAASYFVELGIISFDPFGSRVLIR